jgi:arylsulfatase A-like enzyme
MLPPRISRRAVLTAGTGAAVAFSVSAGAGLATAAGQSRPNILWLVSEDNGPFVGAYGDALARTPTIDRLASQGVRFDNAFAAAPVCAPSRFSIITGMHAESCGPAHHMRASGTLPAGVKGFPEYLRNAGYYCTNNDKTDYNTEISLTRTWHSSGSKAHWRNRPAGTPFFAVFNYMLTHESRLFGAAAGNARPADMRVPAYLPDTAAVRADRAHYYDLMNRMDKQLATRLAELTADGLDEDTIVFYYSDHGGALPRGKRHCYDSGLRVPLVVRFPARWAHLAPGGARAGSVVTTPVSLVDLGPTVLSLIGVAAPGYMHGKAFAGSLPAPARRYTFAQSSRMDERYDLVRTVRDDRYRYIRNYLPQRPRGINQAYAWQLKSYQDWEQGHLDRRLPAASERFWQDKPAEELYDLRADPDELTNLVSDSRVAAKLGELRSALDAHMIEVNDNGFIPESAPTEGYDASRAAGAYPLAQVMALAALAAKRQSANLPTFVQNLTASNPVLRYWAAAGCLMLGTGATSAATALERRMDTDAWVYVRIVAAEALGRMGRLTRAVPYLAGVVDSTEQVPIRLQAVGALTALGAAALPALPAVRKAAQSSDVQLRSAGRYLQFVLEGTYVPASKVYVE